MGSENGWEPARLAPDSPLLVWKIVPGTNPPVHLQVMRGFPEVFLIAWAADWNEFIEPLRDADSACYTPTNSVSTSNHLNATAEDLNWKNHPFRQRGSLNAAQMAVLKEMEDFYEGWMFWAGRWQNPIDEMHSQCGYDTWNDNDRGFDFIHRKIRSDGRSTFRRGSLPGENLPAAAPAFPPIAPAHDDEVAATVLYDAVPIIDMARARKLLPLVRAGLVAAECNTPRKIAMYLAQVGWESDGFNATEEYAKNGRYAPFIGRTWIMVTWQSNYAAFGRWCYDRHLVSDPDVFVKNPRKLADDEWAGLGPAWYITDARPNINAMADAGDLLGVTRAINGGTNGLEDPRPGVPGRRTRWNQAVALGDRLLELINHPDTEDTMPGLTDDEQRELLVNTRWLREQLEVSRPDWGPDADLGTDSQGRPNTLRTAVAKLLRLVDKKPAAGPSSTPPAATS